MIKKIVLNLYFKMKLCLIYLWYKSKPYKKELSKYKNIHKGERCFIIGNGPSLNVEDLNKLSSEYTFVSNRFYTIDTMMVPTYYFMHDSVLLPKNFTRVCETNCKARFFGVHSGTFDYLKQTNTDNNLYYINELKSNKGFTISKDVPKGLNSIGSVSFSMIQLALYMGFKEIYLLGFDHSFSKEIKDGKLVNNKDVVDHFSQYKEGVSVPAKVDDITYGFEIVKEYAQKNNIIIKNITRGGKLEVFQRATLEDIVHEKES